MRGRIPLVVVLVGVLSFGLIGGAAVGQPGQGPSDPSKGGPNINPDRPGKGKKGSAGDPNTAPGCDPSGGTPKKCAQDGNGPPPDGNGPPPDGNGPPPGGNGPNGPGPDGNGPGPFDGGPPEGDLEPTEEVVTGVAQAPEAAAPAEGAVAAAEEAAPAAQAPSELAFTGLELWQLALLSGLTILGGFGLRRAVAHRA